MWIAAAVILVGAMAASMAVPATHEWIKRLAETCAVLIIGGALSAVAGYVFESYNAKANTRNLPLRGVLNLCRGIIWIVVAIVCVAIMLGRSPGYILTGLGAFAAALMLVFKDSILGFVAGIQMSQNDMLHVGDWITVPSTNADGIVEDVSLTSVRIRNFDNTYVTVPPYTLVSTSFQNHRGMSESGARRFMRTLIIDLPSIESCTPELLRRVAEAFPDFKTDGKPETNLELFRSYIEWYVGSHPLIDSTKLYMARLMAPTTEGLPLQIYAFTATTDWHSYEAIQSQITEHIVVAAPLFGLGIYTSGCLTVEQS